MTSSLPKIEERLKEIAERTDGLESVAMDMIRATARLCLDAASDRVLNSGDINQAIARGIAEDIRGIVK